MFMLDFQAARWLVDGEVPRQAGNNHPTSIPTGVFATADGHINIAVAGQAIWLPLLRGDRRRGAGRRSGLCDAGRALAQPRRAQRRARARSCAGSQRRTGSSSLNAAGVPCGPINTIDQVFADPQVRHLGLARACARTSAAAIELVGQPIVMSRTPSRIRTPPPPMGEHTEEILRELGYDDRQIADLRAAEVL